MHLIVAYYPVRKAQRKPGLRRRPIELELHTAARGHNSVSRETFGVGIILSFCLVRKR